MNLRVSPAPSLSFRYFSLNLVSGVSRVDLYSQGEASPVAPLKYAEQLKLQLTNAKDGCRLYVVKGRYASCRKYRPATWLLQGPKLA